MWRAILNRFRGNRQQEQADANQRQRAPFNCVPIPGETRSTYFDPEQGLRTQTQRGIYLLGCGHISADPVGAGRCYLCGRWVCPQCLSVCARCGALLCNMHSIKVDAHGSFCPLCFEQAVESAFFGKALNVIKSILVLPFKE